MLILVLDFRIHSVEYELVRMPEKEDICSGKIEKIGLETALIIHKPKNKPEEKLVRPVFDHTGAMEAILSVLTDKEYGVIKSYDEIDAIGHRVVHGGEKFNKSVIIDEEVKKEIYKNFELAPLHNPYNFKGIETVEKYFPGKPQIAVFDTSFHSTLPEVAYRYPIPENLYENYRIRKYGFHGISHRYVCEKTSSFLKQPINKTNIISIHLGQGSSLCAIKNGVSIDTSMGFTPLEGVMMTTRTGDISPGVLFFLQKSGWSLNNLESCINKSSGILGVSGVSDETLEVVEEMKKGNKRAKLAIDMFVYSVKKYLGAYYLLLGKSLQAISFTGGIGVNSDIIRKMICDGLEFLGIELDDKKNSKIVGNKEGEISKSSSKIKIFVIPRNEKLIIAKDVMDLLKNKL